MTKNQLQQLSRSAILPLALLACAQHARGVTPVSFTGSPITENFDGLGTSGTSLSLIPGWDAGYFNPYVNQSTTGGNGSTTVSATLTVDNGGAGTNTPILINIGTTGAADRALGSFARTSPQGDQFMQLAIKNDSGSPISSFTLSYKGEEWRSSNGTTQQLTLWFSNTSATSGFVSMGSGFTFNTPNNSSSNTAIDGNASGNYTLISGTYTPASPIAAGSTFYIRWYDINDNGISDDYLAIDDVTVTPTVLVVTYPTVVVTTPVNDQKFPPGTLIEATATVGGGGTPPYNVKIFVNDVQVGSDLTGAGPVFTASLGAPAAGNHTIRASVTDSLSQTNTSPTNTFSVVDARYWDTSSTPGLQAGDGSWDSGSSWSIDTTGTSPVSWLEDSEAYFQTPGTSNVTINGTVEAGLLNISGSGTVVNLGIGTLRIASGGGTTIASGSTLQIGSGDTTCSLETATLTNAGTLLFNRDGELAFTGAISGLGALRNTGVGTLTLSGTMGAAATPIGQVILKKGSTVIDGGSLYTNTNFLIGQSSGDNATLTLKGNAVLDTSNAATGDSRIRVGDGGSTGTLIVQDTARLYTGFDRYLMTGALGTVEVKGGNLVPWRVYFTAASNITIDGGNLVGKVYYDSGYTNRNGDAGDWRSSGGARFTLTSGRLGGFNWSDMGLCTFDISGGLFVAGGSNYCGIGNGGVTTFNLTGGEVQWASGRTISGGTYASVFNLGGTSLMDLRSITPGTGTVTFNFDGGTLKAITNNPDSGFMPAAVVGNIKAGGAKIDTAGFGVTIAAALLHDSSLADTADGGLTKSGLGTLTLTGANTYTGTTTVSGGALSLSQACLADTADVGIAAGATLNLTHGTLDFIKALYLGGAKQATGSWGTIGSGADHESAQITGSGQLYVTEAGTGNAYADWLHDSYPSLTGSNRAPDADPDGDGIDNGIEFMTGTSPIDASSRSIPSVTRNGSGDLVLVFQRVVAAEAYEVAVEYCTNLQPPWTAIIVPNNATAGPPVTVIDHAPAADDITVTVPGAPDLTKFARVRISIPYTP